MNSESNLWSGACRGAPIVYVAFSDETGVGDVRIEPILVVTAVVFNPDKDWEGFTQDVGTLIEQFVPENRRDSFEFKAGRLFSRSQKKENCELLSGFLKIPFRRYLNVYSAAVHREGFRQQFLEQATPKQALQITQGLAFFVCAARMEAALRQYVPDQQIKVLWIANKTTAEDSMKQFLKLAQTKRILPDLPSSTLEHIMDTVYFGHSHQSRGLQLADACSYVVKRRLMGDAEIVPYYRLIQMRLSTSDVLFAPEGGA